MAIRFDAASDRLLATANLLSNEGPYSWGGDIYWVSATGSDEVLFSLNDDDPDAAGNDSRDHIYIKGSDSTLRLFIANGSGGYGFGTGSTLSTGTWYNIFIVRASATDIRVYLNGTLDITVTNDMSGRSSFTRQECGGFTSTDVQRFNGRVQNILSIDGIALSAAEVMSQSKRFYPIRLGTSTNRWTPAVQTGTDRTADWIGKYSWTVGGTLTDEAGQPKAWGSGQRRHFRSTAAGALTITPSGIASAEAFGTARLDLYVAPSGIASLEAFGTAVITLSISPSGIASVESVGTHRLDLALLPSSVASAEAFGAPQLNLELLASSIASAEAFGAAVVQQLISGAGNIASLEAFGSATLTIYVAPDGISSEEAIGSHVVSSGADQTLSPSGIASAEAVASPVLTISIAPSGIAGAEGFGVAVLLHDQMLSITGIISEELFGSHVVSGFGVAIPSVPVSTPTGFASEDTAAEFFGKSLTLKWPLRMLPIRDTSKDARNLDENFRRVADWIKPFGGPIPEAYNLARLLGGAYITGDLAAGGSDIEFQHELGRKPSLVLLSVDLNGTGGQVRGTPAGGQGGSGANDAPWTTTSIFVRATVTSRYAFIVI